MTAGIGWFAVNSVSGAFALNTLTHMPKALCLTIIVVVQLAVAFFGHNMVHAFEKFALPVLGLAFLLAAISIFGKASGERAARCRCFVRLGRHRRLLAHVGRRFRVRGRLEPVCL